MRCAQDVDPDSFWHDYGVKLVDGGPREGEKVLDGGGLPQNQQLPGVKRGGGSTLPGRLSRRCAEIIGEVGEEELYHLLREGWADEGASAAAGEEGVHVAEGTAAVVCGELSSWCGAGKGKKRSMKTGHKKGHKKKKKKKKKGQGKKAG